jgi:group I intron endonuclease
MQKSGIYKLHSLHFPERVYVGSSLNCNARISRHLSKLRQNKHINKKLQNHCNKYGVFDLGFQIIEHCSPNQLLIREQFYIDSIKPYFNIRTIAGSNLGLFHSLKTKAKMKLNYILNLRSQPHFKYKIRP